MTSPSIHAVLQQMQSLASQAGSRPEKGQHVATTVGKTGFAEELHGSINRVNQLQQRAEQSVKVFESGSSDLALNDVMVDLQKAQIALQMSVQVRNRLIGAYKEIMNMQV